MVNSNVMEMEERKYIALYVYVSNITEVHKKQSKSSLLIIEADKDGFFISDIHTKMYEAYNSRYMSNIYLKKVYTCTPRFQEDNVFPYKHFLIKDGRLEELSEEFIDLAEEL